ncbi:MAG: DUF4153 domain-containing protein [Firmicutes bacterium]|nr:DUF4153 domain-containing protein [Bacillota bacterium]
MVGKIRTLMQLLAGKILLSIKRFPEAAGMAAATVTLLIVINHWRAPKETVELLTRMAMTLALGFPITLALKVLTEQETRWSRKLPILLLPLALAILFAYFTCLLKELNTITISRYIAYSLICYLAFLFIPYLSNRKHFELYVLNLFIKFCAIYLYAATLFLGLAAILLTIKLLFAVQLSEKLYLDLWLLCAGLFAPVCFLGEIPEHSQTFEPEHYPYVLKVLFVHILIPLLSVYTIILYAYFGKILVTQTWPKGLVAHLVLWYALCGTLLIFILYPLRTRNGIAERFSKLFPWLILPLLAMMFVTMGKRIEAFGVTENRYYVLAAGVWVTGCMLYYCFSKRPRNLLLPVTLALIAFLTVTGPWSSFSVSRYSQNRRLVTLLTKYELWVDGAIAPQSHLSTEAKQEISSIIAYFRDHHSLKEISLLPDDFTIDDMEKVFGFAFTPQRRTGPDGREYFHYQLADKERLFPLEGYELFVDLTGIYSEKTISQRGLTITYSGQEKILVIIEDNKEIYRKNLADLLKEERTAFESAGKWLFMDQNEKLKLRYLVKQVHGWEDPLTGELEIDWVGFYLFIKKR